MENKDFEIVDTMKRFGGSFVKSLADACFKADAENLERIKKAFPEIWERYQEMTNLVKGQK